MADVDVETEVAAGAQPKKRTFRKFSYRGVDLDALLDMSTDDLVQMFPARARRRFKRGLKRKPMALVKKLRKASNRRRRRAFSIARLRRSTPPAAVFTAHCRLRCRPPSSSPAAVFAARCRPPTSSPPVCTEPRKMSICQVCKSNCTTDLSTGSLFAVTFHPSFDDYMIVPCNVRLEFNALTDEDSVVFQGGGAYTFHIRKGSTKTKLYGDDWRRFLTFNKIDVSQQRILFSLGDGESPFIYVYYVNDGGDDDDHDDDHHDDDDHGGDDDDEDTFDDVIFAQRLTLSERERENLVDRLPRHESYIGVPFMTRLSRTNLEGHTMKLPKIFAERCGMEVDEEVLLAGLRLGARGAITTAAYKVDLADGRIILGAENGWKNFLRGKNLRVGQAIIVTIRNPVQANLRMMVVIDII